MKRFALTPAAKADLAEIVTFISQDNPRAAQRVISELRGATRRLAQLPHLGHLRQDLAAEAMRFWPHYSYLIVDRPRPTRLTRCPKNPRAGVVQASGLPPRGSQFERWRYRLAEAIEAKRKAR